MNHFSKFARLGVVAVAALTGCGLASAQLGSIAPGEFTLNVATGGSISSVLGPVVMMAPSASGPVQVPTGTGDRQAIATLCATTQTGSVGIFSTPPCSPGSSFGSVNVGAQANSANPQTVVVNFSPADLAAHNAQLAALGQPATARFFHVVVQFSASPLPPTSQTRFVALRVNLIQPPVVVAPPPQPAASLPIPTPVPVVGGLAAVLGDGAEASPSNASVVALRYQFNGADSPTQGFFCTRLQGAVNSSGVATANPCAAGSVIGQFPAPSMGSGNLRTSLVTVPSSVARQAALAQRNATGQGLYVVQGFSSGRFAVSSLRLTALSASAPLALSEVRLGFVEGSGLAAQGMFKRGQTLPPAAAQLRYQGAGMLRARWEIVQPTDTVPTELDLNAEAHLDSLQRLQQRRYKLLQRVNTYLGAGGEATIPGPDPSLLPNHQYGQYMLLLRIEATEAANGQAAGFAPFALPVLRYWIGEAQSSMRRNVPPADIALQLPAQAKADELQLRWPALAGSHQARIEFARQGQSVFAARVLTNGQAGSYRVPTFVAQGFGSGSLQARVLVFSAGGQLLAASAWRTVNVE